MPGDAERSDAFSPSSRSGEVGSDAALRLTFDICRVCRSMLRDARRCRASHRRFSSSSLRSWSPWAAGSESDSAHDRPTQNGLATGVDCAYMFSRRLVARPFLEAVLTISRCVGATMARTRVGIKAPDYVRQWTEEAPDHLTDLRGNQELLLGRMRGRMVNIPSGPARGGACPRLSLDDGVPPVDQTFYVPSRTGTTSTCRTRRARTATATTAPTA
jgi:hypothetical protein